MKINGFPVERKKLSELKPADWNPRRITDEQAKALRRSLAEFGVVEPIVWNATTQHVIGGHQRLDALLALSETETDVVVVELTEEREKLLNIALNKIHGEWDEAKLTDLLMELQITDIDIALTGFTQEEIERLLSTPEWGGADGSSMLDQQTFYMSFTLDVDENETCRKAMNKAREKHGCAKPKMDFHSSEIFVAMCREYAGA